MTTTIYALKTTVNQEQAVANLVMGSIREIRKDEHGIKAILVPDELRGYVLIEASFSDMIDQIIQNIPHARGLIKGGMNFEEVEHFLTPKPSVTHY